VPSTPPGAGSRQAAGPSSMRAGEDRDSGSEGRRRAHSEAMNAIGARLRARRTDRGLSLRQLTHDLDISASFLSQVENGRALPSVASLYLICSALELSIDELFADWRLDDAGVGDSNVVATPASSGSTAPMPPHGAASPVVTPAERRRLVLDSGVTWEQLSTLPDGIDFMFVRYDVGGSSTLDERLTRHSGVEYGFVMRGTLEVMLGFGTYRLGPGDAISFDSSTPHRLSNVGQEPVEAVWFVRGRDPWRSH
jgi:mannose-6-phosphate isomerase-like protein (cupin superfamily)/DNA-binding XRE family transcriptional regulator